MPARYPVAQRLVQACSFLDIEEPAVLKRLGIPKEKFHTTYASVEGALYLDVLEAVNAETKDPNAMIVMAKGFAKAPFVPPVLAFSCAANVTLGLERLAVFKPLIAPVELHLNRTKTGLCLETKSTVANRHLPPNMELFELCYLLECIRTHTGAHVQPTALQLSNQPEDNSQIKDFFGIAAGSGNGPMMELSAQDAALPLLSNSNDLWDSLEPSLTRQLEELQQSKSMGARVKHLIVNNLPGGATTTEEIARRLHISKRSLQRKLTEEGTSFQSLLNETRAEMSARYLKNSDLRVPEISHLLGFRDTSSFFRAFYSWTGKTPGNFRDEVGQRLN